MTEKNKTTHYEEESKMITNEDKEIGALLGTPFKPVDLPENALDVVKEVLDMVHKGDERRPVILRHFDNMLATEKIIKMLKDDGIY